MRRFFSLMISLTLLQSFIYAQSKMKSFQWLEGEWQMKNKNGLILERWQSVNDTILKSSSYFINDKGERKPLENVKLKYEGGIYYYEPVVQNQKTR